MKLSKGAHAFGSGENCVMEYVSIVTGDMFSDTPSCTDPVIAYAAQSANDVSDNDTRQELVAFVPRLINAHPLRASAAQYDLMQWVRNRAWRFYRHEAPHLMVPMEMINVPYSGFIDSAMGKQVSMEVMQNRRMASHLCRDIGIYKGPRAAHQFLSELLTARDEIAKRHGEFRPQYFEPHNRLPYQDIAQYQKDKQVIDKLATDLQEQLTDAYANKAALAAALKSEAEEALKAQLTTMAAPAAEEE